MYWICVFSFDLDWLLLTSPTDSPCYCLFRSRSKKFRRGMKKTRSDVLTEVSKQILVVSLFQDPVSSLSFFLCQKTDRFSSSPFPGMRRRAKNNPRSAAGDAKVGSFVRSFRKASLEFCRTFHIFFRVRTNARLKSYRRTS